jgi:phosphoglycerate dehydrogenase-like enzyme
VSYGKCYFWLRPASVITHGNYAGKVALVTGSSQGIGQAIAKRLDKLGDKVIGLARHAPKISFPGKFIEVDLGDRLATMFKPPNGIIRRNLMMAIALPP